MQIAVSGGRTSAYMLHQILEANGGLPDRCIVSFQNTGREMPQTLDFVAECGSRWGVNIVWLGYRTDAPFFEVVSHNSASRAGEPFDALIDRKQFLPNNVTRYCTTELKVRPQKRYLLSLGWERWTAATGIRADEPACLRGDPAKERWSVWYPLLKRLIRACSSALAAVVALPVRDRCQPRRNLAPALARGGTAGRRHAFAGASFPSPPRLADPLRGTPTAMGRPADRGRTAAVPARPPGAKAAPCQAPAPPARPER